jgi:hypothetical protein
VPPGPDSERALAVIAQAGKGAALIAVTATVDGFIIVGNSGNQRGSGQDEGGQDRGVPRGSGSVDRFGIGCLLPCIDRNLHNLFNAGIHLRPQQIGAGVDCTGQLGTVCVASSAGSPVFG